MHGQFYIDMTVNQKGTKDFQFFFLFGCCYFSVQLCQFNWNCRQKVAGHHLLLRERIENKEKRPRIARENM